MNITTMYFGLLLKSLLIFNSLVNSHYCNHASRNIEIDSLLTLVSYIHCTILKAKSLKISYTNDEILAWNIKVIIISNIYEFFTISNTGYTNIRLNHLEAIYGNLMINSNTDLVSLELNSLKKIEGHKLVTNLTSQTLKLWIFGSLSINLRFVRIFTIHYPSKAKL